MQKNKWLNSINIWKQHLPALLFDDVLCGSFTILDYNKNVFYDCFNVRDGNGLGLG